MSDSKDGGIDQHVEDCDTCGNGPGVCLEGYLLAVDERNDRSLETDTEQ